MSQCSGCGADIKWAVLNGRPHPFNPRATPGLFQLSVNDLGEDVAVSVGKVHTSHFSTCPNAADFRKKR